MSCMTDGLQKMLETDGYAIVPAALDESLLDGVEAAVDRIYGDELTAGRIAADGSLHLLGAISRDSVFLELLDLPTTLPLVCGSLGWNIYVYHSHLESIRRRVPTCRNGAGTRTVGARTSSWRPRRGRACP